MLDVHAAAIETTIRNCPVVVTHSLNRVQLSPSTGWTADDLINPDDVNYFSK